MEELERLREITRTLRDPGGCEWDRAQTYESMRPHLIEEAYEIIDAIDRADYDELREELGDMLFLVHFFARLGEEEGRFNLNDVARNVSDKLVRRHPHVFGDVKVDGVEDILRNWERIKKTEKKDYSGTATGEEDAPPDHKSAISKTEDYLPALFRAFKLQTRAASVGFDWPDYRGPIAKIREELAELEAELEKNPPRNLEGVASPSGPLEGASPAEEELGDLLFSVVNLARKMNVNPEPALTAASEKFIRRFRHTEKQAWEEDLELRDCSPEKLDELWESAKSALAGGG